MPALNFDRAHLCLACGGLCHHRDNDGFEDIHRLGAKTDCPACIEHIWSEHQAEAEGGLSDVEKEEMHLFDQGFAWDDMCAMIMPETDKAPPYTAYICPVCDCFLGTGYGCFSCTAHNISAHNISNKDPDPIFSSYPDYDIYDEEIKNRRHHVRRFDTLGKDKKKRGGYKGRKNNWHYKTDYGISSVLSRNMSMRGFHDTCHGCNSNSNIYSCNCRVLDMAEDFYDAYIIEDEDCDSIDEAFNSIAIRRMLVRRSFNGPF